MASHRKASGGVHAAGVGLLVSGVLLAGAAVSVAVLALTSPHSVPLIDYLRREIGGGYTVLNAVVGGQSVQLQGSDSLASIMALGICGTLLLVLASVARTLVTAGSRLMRPGHTVPDDVSHDADEITRRALERVASAGPMRSSAH